MSKRIFIGVAWPYANGSLHLGHIAGCYLPADIFARYNRMKNRDVLMVSGSDEHGTPITITAEKEKTTPQTIVDRYNKEHTENMIQLGISFDLFTRTTTENHKKIVQKIFLELYKKGYIYEKDVDAFYCRKCSRFLPDRYIEGTCPHCSYDKARGDQCDSCGKLLDPHELINVRCKICGETPTIQRSNHLFFALSKFETKLLKWIKGKKHWKPSVLKFTYNWLKDGLKDRTITRDIEWGIEVPLKGFEDKRIYVWFDAVIGYLSASIEWAQKKGEADAWEKWWKNKDVRHYYFLAKDNIPFHTLIWPAILMGYDETLNLPYDIPANEYLCLKGEQFSKSRGVAVWIPDILQKFDADAIRYYLSINMPENRDTNWIWSDFVAKNNDELVGTYGNFVHRVITFTQKNFGCIPPKEEKLSQLDKEAIKKIEETQKKVEEAIEKCHFKKGLRTAMQLAQYGNFYFDQNQPWKLIKSDKKRCKTVLHICIKIVQALAIIMTPYLPFSSNKIWKLLGHKKTIYECSWEDALSDIKTGTTLEKPKPLFKKLILEDFMTETDPFSKLDLRVAKIIDVKEHPQADKLYILNVDLGPLGKRTLVAGIKTYYTKEEIKGKNIVIVANLKAAKIRGVESKGMLLAAEDKNGNISLLHPQNSEPGSEIYVEGIPREPATTLELDDFKKIVMKVNEKQEVTYNEKTLRSKKGPIVTDRRIMVGAKIL
ncbi:MAG: methionine--tRNA ligase [Thermoplasmata archaeon]|nr:MAG: methionine--tRNA ligase [Thermoplasmata archaeon]